MREKLKEELRIRRERTNITKEDVLASLGLENNRYVKRFILSRPERISNGFDSCLLRLPSVFKTNNDYQQLYLGMDCKFSGDQIVFKHAGDGRGFRLNDWRTFRRFHCQKFNQLLEDCLSDRTKEWHESVLQLFRLGEELNDAINQLIAITPNLERLKLPIPAEKTREFLEAFDRDEEAHKAERLSFEELFTKFWHCTDYEYYAGEFLEEYKEEITQQYERVVQENKEFFDVFDRIESELKELKTLFEMARTL